MLSTKLNNNSMHERFRAKLKTPSEDAVRDGDVFNGGNFAQLKEGTPIFPNRKDLTFINVNLTNCKTPPGSVQIGCSLNNSEMVFPDDPVEPPVITHKSKINMPSITEKEMRRRIEPFLVEKKRLEEIKDKNRAKREEKFRRSEFL